MSNLNAYGPSAELMQITPDVAKDFLSLNKGNRHVRQRVVDVYARDMENGNWQLTGEAIKFASDGSLLDGQHRLLAVIQSGCTVTMFVIRHIQKSAQSVMDAGSARQASDNLAMNGVRHSALIASVAKTGVMHDRGVKDIGKGNVSHSEIYEWVKNNPDVHEAAAITSRYGHRVYCAPSAIAYASLLIYRATKDWYAIDEFWCAAADKVGLKHGDPVIALTNRFIQDRSKRIVMPRMALISAIVRAWNARREGKTMTRSSYENRNGEFIEIPEVIL